MTIPSNISLAFILSLVLVLAICSDYSDFKFIFKCKKFFNSLLINNKSLCNHDYALFIFTHNHLVMLRFMKIESIKMNVFIKQLHCYSVFN